MPKALFFLLFLTIFSLASLWFVENDGSIVIDWMGYRIQTSVAFAVLFLIITIVACTLFLQLILWIKSGPGRFRKARKERRFSQGLIALTQGFAALAAGDTAQARSLTKRASNNLDNMPITKLLAAQTAQLEGNREMAKEHYSAMLEDKNKNKETEIIAIKGLLLEAREDNDLGKALFLAEKAYKLKPDADWVILILLDLYRKTHKWGKAEELTKKALKYKLIPKESAQRIFGLTAFAMYEDNLKHGRDEDSKYLVKKAYKSAPDVVPIIISYAKMLAMSDKTRKEVKLLESHWRVTPHPDIATAYIEIYADSSEEVRLEKAARLLELQPSQPESHFIYASMALEAGQLGLARQHLKIALSHGETKSLCLLMAELETMDRASHEVVHYWRERGIMANDFAVWQCSKCQKKSESWNILCHNCGSFDSIQWKTAPAVVNTGSVRLLDSKDFR